MFCVYLNPTCCCNKKKNLFTTNAAVVLERDRKSKMLILRWYL